MSAVPSPVRSEGARAAAGADLEVRIHAAELRLIAREEDLQRRAEVVMQRVRTALQPRRLLVPALGAVAAGIALWWGLRRLGRGLPVPAAHPAPAAEPHAGGQLPWASLLGLAWPLLPAPWRARVSPATATTVLGVGLPLLQRLFERTPAQPPLATMPQVDLARYAGTWHEIARLPAPFEARCEGQPSATYRLRGAGIEVINRCPRGGRIDEARGAARVVPGSGGAKLEFSLWPEALRWLPLAWAKYWILYVDPDYRVALVGHPNRRFLWVLSRTPTLATPQLEALVEFAEQRGFPVDRLNFVQPDRNP